LPELIEKGGSAKEAVESKGLSQVTVLLQAHRWWSLINSVYQHASFSNPTVHCIRKIASNDSIAFSVQTWPKLFESRVETT